MFTDTFNNADPCANSRRNTGMLLGGVAGALIGAKTGNRKTGEVLAGALLGTAVGGLIGAELDKRRCALAKVAKDYNLQMTFAAVAQDGGTVHDAQMARLAQSGQAEDVKRNAIGSVVSVQDSGGAGGHFEKNSDALTPRAQQYFSAIATVYHEDVAAAVQSGQSDARARFAERKFLLLGHTDDTGSSRVNAELSERRARAVAQYLERRGIGRDQIFYQGAGEVYPIGDNNSEGGRAQNRRVEIVELSNAAALAKYLNARRPDYRYYRAGPSRSDEVAASGSLADAATSSTAKPASRKSAPQREHVAGKPGASAPAGKAKQGVDTPDQRTAMRTAKPRLPAAGARSSAGVAAAAAQAASPAARTAGKVLDFGGQPFNERSLAAGRIGKLEQDKPLFTLISSAHADEMSVLSDCTRDRPRVSGAVRALRDGASYKVIEHVPGLYGKTWTDRVNGHQVVINKVAVLANEGSLAQTPELKVYANYNPALNRNPKPDVSLSPQVNTYLGEQGILYRIFADGAGGMQCVDIVYPRQGGAAAKGGNIVYARDEGLFQTTFKPVIAN